ncbi:hypothetical protein [Photobacterium sp. TLY01]|uniref:hypothetical protein n=1 Tax=Photobacterium sp. TLY01 TaxID=2907534 RepID=UPI001F389E30|nr:hypothetical protein [Photobacterium sp. TLY01]UIP28895.1 hypothetical protein LN341_05285 [Photobacterium sp. TLY01]
MNITQTVTLWRERFVTVHLPTMVVQYREKQPAGLQVVTVGAQGPVGTVAEEILSRVEVVEAAAQTATQTAATALQGYADNRQSLDDVITKMTNRFNYHAGVISA